MEDFKVRVIEERDELLIKLDKLGTFLYSASFETLGKKDKDLLVKQFAAMQKYVEILNIRIDAFSE